MLLQWSISKDSVCSLGRSSTILRQHDRSMLPRSFRLYSRRSQQSALHRSSHRSAAQRSRQQWSFRSWERQHLLILGFLGLWDRCWMPPLLFRLWLSPTAHPGGAS